MASGVRSFTAKPVPPDVTMRLTGYSLSHHSRIFDLMLDSLSGIMLSCSTVQCPSPSSAKTLESKGMVLSDVGVVCAVSEMISIAADR